MYFHST